MDTLATRLKELRAERNVTQRQTAAAVGISEISYQRYEYGRPPAYDKLIQLADFFDVSLDYLVGRTDNPEINR